MLSPLNENKKGWFSNLFKCATISMNVSSRGPIIVSTTPKNCFDRTVLENLGLRAILSAGIGEHNYQDRIFSARITLPKLKNRQYEALIFNFIVLEDSEHITLKMNSKALTLLIFIYPKKLRRFINRFEEDFELLLSQTSLLPKNTSELLNEEDLMAFINTLRKSIISFENESLLEYEEFTISKLYDEETMSIDTQLYINEFF